MLAPKEYGLSQAIYSKLCHIFKQQSEITQVKLFGSRAKGNYTDRSDIDLALFGGAIDRFTVARVLLDADDSDIPFTVDAQHYSDINNQKLRNHIDRVGVSIYP